MSTLRVLLLLIAATVSIDAGSYDVVAPTNWWQTTVLYEIWPRSFKDSDGDGIGDFNGITSKLDHFVDTGIETIWLAPFYTSPMTDSGYDVADYRDVNPTYGTLDDFDTLVSRAHELGLKVVIDFVPNHVSDQHEWFVKSKNGIEPYTDYFVWNEGIEVNGTRQPINNWVNAFYGSAWQWHDSRNAYCLHQFNEHQIDLNFANPLVIQESKDVLTFWLDRGVDGFRVDAVNFLTEDPSLKDEPLSGLDYPSTSYYYLDHIYTKDQQGSYEIFKIWSDHVEDYTAAANDGVVRALFTEGYADIAFVMKWYDYGAHVPFNFFFLKDGDFTNDPVTETASDMVAIIDKWMSAIPANATANWVFGNHDNLRVPTRFRTSLIDGINFLLFLLPGIATIYNGDEIGMQDTFLTWEETEDVQACSMDEDSYTRYSRDPVRTPYQWDNTTSAGFSTNSTTMLKVNENYLTLNLAAQKEADVSHFKNVRALTALRSTTVVQKGSLNVRVIDDTVIAFTREYDGEEPIVVLINWDKTTEMTVSLDIFENVPETVEVIIADISSGIEVGYMYDKTSVSLPGHAAVVLRGISKQQIGPRPGKNLFMLDLMSLDVQMINNQYNEST